MILITMRGDIHEFYCRQYMILIFSMTLIQIRIRAVDGRCGLSTIPASLAQEIAPMFGRITNHGPPT